MHTTSKSTQAEIVAEAQAITAQERATVEAERTALIMALRKESGLIYSACVSKARYTLQIVDYSGKNTKVTDISEPMPFYEFNEFLRNFKHTA